MSRGSFERQFAEAKQASVGQLLMRCARLWNEQALARFSSAGFEVRTSHTLLFPHLELEGIRLTELSRRVGVSKQAVGQLVAELESIGMLERVPDPLDGRAKLIVFTERGRKSLFVGLGALAEVQAELADAIGAQSMARLHGLLVDLEAALERGS